MLPARQVALGPLAVEAGIFAFLMLVVLAPRMVHDMEWGGFLGTWFLLGLAADLGFGLHARHKLLTEFRLLATQRYQRQLPVWKRLLGALPRQL